MAWNADHLRFSDRLMGDPYQRIETVFIWHHHFLSFALSIFHLYSQVDVLTCGVTFRLL